MHVSLAKVLRAAGVGPPSGSSSASPARRGNGPDGDREAYYFGARDPSGYASDVDAVVNMFDVFCTGFGGQTLGYETAADGGFSLSSPPTTTPSGRWSLSVLQTAVAHFADVVVLDLDLDVHADVRSGVDAVVRAFLDHPTTAEGTGVKRCEDEAGAHEQTLAAPYRWSYRWRGHATTRRRDFAIGSKARSRSRRGRCV